MHRRTTTACANCRTCAKHARWPTGSKRSRCAPRSPRKTRPSSSAAACSSSPPPTRRDSPTVRTRVGCPDSCACVDDRTLAIPDYDGNGQYRSWGNVRVNPQVGLLFVDFETPKRLRVNGTAVVSDGRSAAGGIPGRGVPGAHDGAAHLSQLPALHPQDAARGGIGVRAAPAIHAAGARVENLRRIQGRTAAARPSYGSGRLALQGLRSLSCIPAHGGAPEWRHEKVTHHVARCARAGRLRNS